MSPLCPCEVPLWECRGLTRKVSSTLLKHLEAGRGSLKLLAAGDLEFLQPVLSEEYFRISNYCGSWVGEILDV